MSALQLALSCALLALCGAASQKPEYVDYRPGTLNLIITVPHGGKEMPDTIANRTAGCLVAGSCIYRHNCSADYVNCPVTIEPDSYTYKAAEKIRDYLQYLTGRYPHLILNRLDRIKLDPNREIEEATFGEQIAVENYLYYHNLVDVAKAEIQNSSLFNSLLVIDLHGQSHSHNLTELGYNLTAEELDSESYSLQLSSTLRYAARKLNYSNSIITGKASLGYLMEQQSIMCLPSPTSPKVDGRKYFNGGYTSVTHSSEETDALQLEIARVVRFTSSDAQFDENMRRIARGITNFLDMHYSEKKQPSNGNKLASFSNSFLLILATMLMVLY